MKSQICIFRFGEAQECVQTGSKASKHCLRAGEAWYPVANIRGHHRERRSLGSGEGMYINNLSSPGCLHRVLHQRFQRTCVFL